MQVQSDVLQQERCIGLFLWHHWQSDLVGWFERMENFLSVAITMKFTIVYRHLEHCSCSHSFNVCSPSGRVAQMRDMLHRCPFIDSFDDPLFE